MKKYSKILLIAALSILLVSIFAFSASAATYTIKNATDFKTYLYDSSLWGGNHTYNITTNSIVLTGTQTPIGNNSTPFKGTINGDADGDGVSCTISGINVSTSSAYTGFFGATANSKFSDLILKGSVKSTYKGTGDDENGIVGGLMGRSRGNLTVDNVDSLLTVTSSGSAVGGIVGQICMNTAGCTILMDGCSNQGAVKGLKHVGGIVGRVGGADATHSLKGTVTINNCKNIATVTASGNCAAGIIGYFDYRNTADLGTLNVTYCSNTGHITGGNYVGGIVGLYLASTQKYNAALKMKILHNRGLIDSTNGSYKGGIVGCLYAPILDATTNKPATTYILEDWQHVGLDKDEGLVGIIGKPGDGQNAAEITILRAYNMVGKQILRSKDTISGTVAFNYNNITLNTCRNVNSSASSMASLDSSSDLWKTNTETGVVTLDFFGHASHTYSNGKCTFCLACNSYHGNDNREWEYNSTTKKYFVKCTNCGETYLESVTPPTVYVGIGGNDFNTGASRDTRVLTLEEAVSRLTSVGGTVAICGQLPIENDIILPAWKNTITFTVDKSSGNTSHNSGNHVQSGFLVKVMNVQLQLNGNAIFDDILFKANDASNYRIIISANWYNLDMKYVRAVNNATCYIIAGKYGEAEDASTLTATKNTNITIDGPSLTDSFASSVGYFYERIVLGSSPIETVTVKNKTVTLTVQDGYTTASSATRTEHALIYFLYTMSSADRLQTVYTENCTSNVYFNDNSMVHAFSTGTHNVGEAGTETFVNPDGTEETITFTVGNAYLDKLNVYFNDNSNITDGLSANKTALNKPFATSSDKIFENLGRFYVKNVKNIVIKISDEDGIDEYVGEGTRTTPIYHNLFFFRNGTFDSESINATITAEYGRHGFLPNLGDDTFFEGGPATSRSTYAYTLTQSVDAECVWDDGVITTAPTPSKDGVKKFTCTICGRTKTEPVKHEHAYVIMADGTYYCYDFTAGKKWTECALTAPTTAVVAAAVPATNCNTVSVDVTLSATSAIAASVFKVDAPSGFKLVSVATNLPATENGTGLTVTASDTLPCTVMLVRNPATDATVAKSVVVTLTFDVSAVAHDASKSHIIRVYDAESYNTAETSIATAAVSAEVKVTHNSAVTPAVAPTCTATGLTEGTHCSVCSVVLTAQTTVPMIEHPWSDYVDNGDGTHTRTCTECGKTDSGNHFYPYVGEHPYIADGVGPTTWTKADENQHMRVCQYCGNEHYSDHKYTYKFTVSDVKDPTCTEAGSTEVIMCDVCLHTVGGEEIPATNHEENTNFTWEYNIEDGYHIRCSECNEILIAKDANVTVGLGLELLDEYMLEYLVPADGEVEMCWMLIETTDANGNVEQSLVEPTLVNGTNRFAVSGIAAKNMNDEITATYYFVKDDVLYKAPSRSYNIITYYTFAVRSYANVARGPVLIDLLTAMINYGAAAQTYFEYNHEEGNSSYHGLVTKHLPVDKIVDYTTADVDASDTAVIGELEDSHLYIADSQYAALNQRISMVLVFRTANVDVSIDTSSLVFKAQYKNINGIDKTIEISGDDMVVVDDTVYVTVDKIAAKDLRQAFTGALYIGDEQVSQSVTTSFECYAARIISSENSALEESGIANPASLKAVCKATLAYSDAVVKYFIYGTADELK